MHFSPIPTHLLCGLPLPPFPLMTELSWSRARVQSDIYIVSAENFPDVQALSASVIMIGHAAVRARSLQHLVLNSLNFATLESDNS